MIDPTRIRALVFDVFGTVFELVRYVEAKQSGDASVVDPLRHGAPVAPVPVADESPWS